MPNSTGYNMLEYPSPFLNDITSSGIYLRLERG